MHPILDATEVPWGPCSEFSVTQTTRYGFLWRRRRVVIITARQVPLPPETGGLKQVIGATAELTITVDGNHVVTVADPNLSIRDDMSLAYVVLRMAMSSCFPPEHRPLAVELATKHGAGYGQAIDELAKFLFSTDRP